MEQVGRPLAGVGLPWPSCASVGVECLVLTPSPITRYSWGTCNMETISSSPPLVLRPADGAGFPLLALLLCAPSLSGGEALYPPQLFSDLHAWVSAVSGQRHTGY